MAWSPTIRQVDTRQIVTNLLAFIEAHQTEALAWASGGVLPALPDFARLYPSAKGRVAEVFPVLMVIRRERANSYEGDMNTCAVRLTLDGRLSGADPDALIEEAEFYAAAVESMVTNIPKNELLENIRYFSTVQVDSIESELDITRDYGRGAFVQIFQTQFTYILRGGING